MNKKFPSTILNVLELLIVPYLVSGIFFMVILFSGVDDQLATTILFGLWGLNIILYDWIRNGKRFSFDFNLRLPKIKWIFYSFLFVATLEVSLVYPLSFLINFLIQKDQSQSSYTELFSILAFGAVFIGPLVEELIFRGIILNVLKVKYGNKLALIVSSVLFSVVHVNPSQMAVALVIGLILGYIFILTNSLAFVILLHSMSNLTSILIGKFFIKDVAKENLNSYMIYGEFSFFIMGIAVLICSYLFWKFWNGRGELEGLRDLHKQETGL
jgi:membrane protease YdiL (CAAX protease family)